MYEVIYKRGAGIGSLIVKKDNAYYLVSLDMDNVLKAIPSDTPDMFLKFGYYEQINKGDIDERAKARLDEIMSKV